MPDIRAFDEMWADYATANFNFPKPGGISSYLSEPGVKWILYLPYSGEGGYKWKREIPLQRDGLGDPGADPVHEWDVPDKQSDYELQSDPISPKHYQGFSNGAEVIDITENLNFNRGNCVKYATRAGAKDPTKEIEDLKKSRWYLDREIARLEREAL